MANSITQMSLGTAIPVFCASVAASLVASLVFARKLDEVSERLGASEGLHGILTALGNLVGLTIWVTAATLGIAALQGPQVGRVHG